MLQRGKKVENMKGSLAKVETVAVLECQNEEGVRMGQRQYLRTKDG